MRAESYEIMADNKVLYEVTWFSVRSDEVTNILERR
jgi:hypothetical protein